MCLVVFLSEKYKPVACPKLATMQTYVLLELTGKHQLVVCPMVALWG